MTINAKDKFREGFIMLKRPFEFVELKNPLQKFTILWAYSEQPVIKNYLTKEAEEELREIEETSGIGFFNKTQKEEYIEKEIEKVLKDRRSYEPLYEGEIVQAFVDGAMCRFYPDEYQIVSIEKLTDLMQEEGYHTICDNSIYQIKDFINKKHYLQSRGIPERIAKKWASLSYKSLVLFKPYYELLEMFCRPNEIISNDSFYEEIEGIDFTELNKIQKEIADSQRKPFNLI